MNAKEKIQQLEEALQSERQKQATFARAISHSLKNSLGLVNSFAAIALRDGATLSAEEMTDTLETIARNGRMALYIVEELRLWGQTCQDKMNEPEDCQLAEVLDKVIKHCADLVHYGQAQIDQTVTDLIVSCDKRALEEILLNLVAYLLRYGRRPNKITISSEQNEAGVVLSVCGLYVQGVTPDLLFQPHVNQPVQSDGYGLGLPFAQKLAYLSRLTLTAELRVAPRQLCFRLHFPAN